METLEVCFVDLSPGRLACEVPGEPVTCQNLTDGSMKTSAEAGALYLLLQPGTPEPWTVEAARTAGYTLDVQYGPDVVIPLSTRRAPEPEPEPEPEHEAHPRRRSS